MLQIDRRKTYSFENFRFKNYISLTDEEKHQMLEWRNHIDIRKNMYNTQPISLDNHMAFIKSLEVRTDRFYWMVCDDDKAIGSLNIVDVDWDNGTAELGYYMAPENLGGGDGIFFIYKVLAFVFDVLGMNSLYGATNTDNKAAAYIDEYYGFVKTGKKTLLIDGKEVDFDEHCLTSDSFNKDRAEKIKIENVLKFFKEKKKSSRISN